MKIFFWPMSTSNFFPITTVHYLLSLPSNFSWLIPGENWLKAFKSDKIYSTPASHLCHNLRSTIKLKKNTKKYAPWCCWATLPTCTHSTKTTVKDAKNICLTFSLSGTVSRFKAMCRWSSIHWLLRNCSLVHYCVHKGPRMDTVPNCIISVYILPSYFFEPHHPPICT